MKKQPTSQLRARLPISLRWALEEIRDLSNRIERANLNLTQVVIKCLWSGLEVETKKLLHKQKNPKL